MKSKILGKRELPEILLFPSPHEDRDRERSLGEKNNLPSRITTSDSRLFLDIDIMNEDKVQLVLKNSELFKNCHNDIIISKLKQFKIKTYKKDESIFKQLDHSDSILIILKGTVELYSDNLLIATRNDFEIIGELGVIGESPRTTDAICSSDKVELIKIEDKIFYQMLTSEFQIFQNLLKILADKLKQTTYYQTLLAKKEQELHSEINKRVKAEKEFRRLAHYDILTGLPNRFLLNDRLQMEISKSERYKNLFAILFIDLDQFKYVNDTMGHQMGDFVLIQTAKRLLSSVRKMDTVARLGGDEFIIITPKINSIKDVSRIVERIMDSITKEIRFEDKFARVTASIGIAIYPFDGKTIRELLEYSDIAMYYAKENGKNDYKFYSKSYPFDRSSS